MLNMLDENVQKITDVMGQTSQQVEDLINSVDQAIRSDLDQLDHGGNLLQDVTSMKSAEDTDGVITSCRNYGAVEADLNAGGIAGSMNVDYEDDQEKDPDMSSLNIVTRINASSVVAYSVNYGKVEVKKDNGGGIVGLQELDWSMAVSPTATFHPIPVPIWEVSRETAWQPFRIPMSEARWRALIIWAVLPAAEPR